MNYDTIFEVALENVGHEVVFLPNASDSPDAICVCKPHGSLNLFVGDENFYYARPFFAGSVQPSDGASNYRSLMPPRLNKKYEQHPVSRFLINTITEKRPSKVVFWGVGLTDSDIDLLVLYKRWCRSASSIDFVNPSVPDAERASRLLGSRINHFRDLSDWFAA